MDEIKKSIQLILYERVSSPLSGALIFSWCAWNWRVLYNLLAPEPLFSIKQRLEVVHVLLSDLYHSIYFPIGSALFLVLIYPIATTGALWAWLNYRKIQNNIKLNIEGQQLLTLEKSLELRTRLRTLEEAYSKLLTEKDQEIASLKQENKSLGETVQNLTISIEQLNDKGSKPYAAVQDTLSRLNEEQRDEKVFNIITDSLELRTAFISIIEAIQSNQKIPEFVSKTVLAFFVSNNIIETTDKFLSKYEFTSKGVKFVRRFLNDNYDSENTKKEKK